MQNDNLYGDITGYQRDPQKQQQQQQHQQQHLQQQQHLKQSYVPPSHQQQYSAPQQIVYQQPQFFTPQHQRQTSGSSMVQLDMHNPLFDFPSQPQVQTQLQQPHFGVSSPAAWPLGHKRNQQSISTALGSFHMEHPDIGTYMNPAHQPPVEPGIYLQPSPSIHQYGTSQSEQLAPIIKEDAKLQQALESLRMEISLKDLAKQYEITYEDMKSVSKDVNSKEFHEKERLRQVFTIRCLLQFLYIPSESELRRRQKETNQSQSYSPSRHAGLIASVPRVNVYATYHRLTESCQVEPFGSSSLGKLLRITFSGIQTKRLGTRGQSKYHYMGIDIKPEYLKLSAVSDIDAKGKFSNRAVEASLREQSQAKKKKSTPHLFEIKQNLDVSEHIESPFHSYINNYTGLPSEHALQLILEAPHLESPTASSFHQNLILGSSDALLKMIETANSSLLDDLQVYFDVVVLLLSDAKMVKQLVYGENLVVVANQFMGFLDAGTASLDTERIRALHSFVNILSKFIKGLKFNDEFERVITDALIKDSLVDELNSVAAGSFGTWEEFNNLVFDSESKKCLQTFGISESTNIANILIEFFNKEIPNFLTALTNTNEVDIQVLTRLIPLIVDLFSKVREALGTQPLRLQSFLMLFDTFQMIVLKYITFKVDDALAESRKSVTYNLWLLCSSINEWLTIISETFGLYEMIQKKKESSTTEPL